MARKGMDIIDELDEKYVVVSLNGSTRIFYWQPSTIYEGMDEPVFASKQNMADFLMNKTVVVRDPFTGKPKTMPAFEYWMKNADRPTAMGVVMENVPERFVRGAVNTWQGFGVVPTKGNFDLMVKHIKEVLCPEPAVAKYFIKWLAWRVQNPCSRTEVAVVFRGDKGTGKGTLATWLRAMFGVHSLQISDRKSLTGNFNAHLSRCCLLVADEALWPGDPTGEGALKRMITEPTLFIEPKGINGYEDINHLAIILLSNAGWVVPATAKERRFVVTDVLDIHQQDHEYFDALKKQAETEGGIEAFLYYLLHLDLKGWHPRQDMPITQGLRDQQAESAGPAEIWLGRILETGMLPAKVRMPSTGDVRPVVRATMPNQAIKHHLYEHFVQSSVKARYTPEKDVMSMLFKMGVTKDPKRSNMGTWLVFPSLPKMRDAFREAYPYYPEFDHPHAEWMKPWDAATIEEVGRFDGDEPTVDDPDFP